MPHTTQRCEEEAPVKEDTLIVIAIDWQIVLERNVKANPRNVPPKNHRRKVRRLQRKSRRFADEVAHRRVSLIGLGAQDVQMFAIDHSIPVNA